MRSAAGLLTEPPSSFSRTTQPGETGRRGGFIRRGLPRNGRTTVSDRCARACRS
jgi:hypothetical protein